MATEIDDRRKRMIEALAVEYNGYGSQPDIAVVVTFSSEEAALYRALTYFPEDEERAKFINEQAIKNMAGSNNRGKPGIEYDEFVM